MNLVIRSQYLQIIQGKSTLAEYDTHVECFSHVLA